MSIPIISHKISENEDIFTDSKIAIYRLCIEAEKESLIGIFVEEKHKVKEALEKGLTVKGRYDTYKVSKDEMKIVSDDSLAIDVFRIENLETGFNPFSEIP